MVLAAGTRETVPQLQVNVSKAITSQRIKSSGDYNGKGITYRQYLRNLVACPSCGKYRSINSRDHKTSACTRFKSKNPQADVAQSLLMLVNLSYFPAVDSNDDGGVAAQYDGSEEKNQFKIDYISDLEEENDGNEIQYLQAEEENEVVEEEQI